MIDPRGLTTSQLRQVLLAGPIATALLGLVFASAALGASSDLTSGLFAGPAAGVLVCVVATVRELFPGDDAEARLSDRGQLRKLREYRPRDVPVPTEAAHQSSQGPPRPSALDEKQPGRQGGSSLWEQAGCRSGGGKC